MKEIGLAQTAEEQSHHFHLNQETQATLNAKNASQAIDKLKKHPAFRQGVFLFISRYRATFRTLFAQCVKFWGDSIGCIMKVRHPAFK